MIDTIDTRALVDVANVHYVDSFTSPRGTNFLFRGALPLTGDAANGYTFNYGGLKSAINKAAISANVKIPEDYKLIDINLLQWEIPDDVPKIQAEYNYFNENSDKGLFMFWETKGTGLCPFEPPLSTEGVQTFLAQNLDLWLSDMLISRTDDLRLALEISEPTTVIYVHCNGGDDRTGEMIGAYYLRHLNMTWSEMNAHNHKFAGGPFGCNNYRAVLWYAIYLNLKFGHPTDHEQPFECNNNGTPEHACIKG
jgi:hypothetical protein